MNLKMMEKRLPQISIHGEAARAFATKVSLAGRQRITMEEKPTAASLRLNKYGFDFVQAVSGEEQAIKEEPRDSAKSRQLERAKAKDEGEDGGETV